jgi:hypothetical protein
MDFKQSTFQEILDSEREMVLRAEERFGTYYVNAFRFSELLTRSIKTYIRPDDIRAVPVSGA